MNNHSEFVTVTKDRFFEVIGKMDVHPYPQREFTLWETTSRRVVGRTEPGYVNVQQVQPVYQLRSAA